MTELRLKVPVSNISVMLGLLPEREREKNGIDLKAQIPTQNLPQVKPISSCNQAKIDRAIPESLQFLSENAPSTTYWVSLSWKPRRQVFSHCGPNIAQYAFFWFEKQGSRRNLCS